MNARRLFQELRGLIAQDSISQGATEQETRDLLARVAASLRSAARACRDVHGPQREAAILFWSGTDLANRWHSDIRFSEFENFDSKGATQ
jgi:hypothetical protein